MHCLLQKEVTAKSDSWIGYLLARQRATVGSVTSLLCLEATSSVNITRNVNNSFLQIPPIRETKKAKTDTCNTICTLYVGAKEGVWYEQGNGSVEYSVRTYIFLIYYNPVE